MSILQNSRVLITGGTGSFGSEFVAMTLRDFNPKKLVIFSRDEIKQWEMANRFRNDDRIRFFIGDVRDKERLYRALAGIDYVVHAAATKIVPISEYNPFECIKTNILGAMNVIDAAIDQRVKKVVALSTDKACSPVNLYGATKLASDKLFMAANETYASGSQTKFSVVRYGNVMGSRGSVIPYFRKLKEHNLKFTITHPDMTRFMITLDQGVRLVWKALEEMHGGEIFVKKLPSINIIDIAKAIDPNAELEFIGTRPGEKIHEEMINTVDSSFTYEFEDHYRIYSALMNHEVISRSFKEAKRVPEDFLYSSNNNSEWLAVEDLREWIRLHYVD